jgi:predicted permease
MQHHVAMKAQAHVEKGMSADEARNAARREFGNALLLREKSRDMWGWNLMESLLQDVRYGARMLVKNPVFTCTAVLMLSLGMCASVAIFAFVDAALLKPLPYQNPSRLVGVYESVGMIPYSNLSYADFLDWKKLNRVFSSLEVWNGTGYLLSTPSGAQPARAIRVSAGFLHTLGVTPVLGRDFQSGEDSPGAPDTVMLSYGAWQKWFGSRQDVVGQAVNLSGVPYTVIGVLPRNFHFAPRGSAEFWTALRPTGSCELRRSCHNLYGVARLKEGVTVQMALADVTTIAQQLEKQYPDSNRGQGAAVVALSEAIVGDIRPILLVLLAGAGLLLLIGCVNVTSLLLARSESRRREIAVRGALGASSARLLRQFATEAVMLVAAGSLLGLLSAEWVMQMLVRLVPADMISTMPYLDGLGLNPRVAAFAAVISMLAAILFALAPTFRLSLSRTREGLAEGGRGSAGTMWRRFGSNLVIVELAIAVVLLVGAGLLGKSFYRLLRVDLGFEPDHLATLEVVAPDSRYGKDEQAVQLGREVIGAIVNLPGVKSAAISNRLPVSGNGFTDWIRFVGRPYNGEHNEVNMRDVSADYFTTLRAKLIRGRYFSDEDDMSKPRVVIINQALAQKYFPDEDPIGKQMGDTSLSPKSIREIIGVVDNIREGSLDSEIWPAEYLPFNQSPDGYFSVVVQTSQDEQSVLPTLVAAIHHIDPDLGTLGEATMADQVDDSQTAYLHRSSAWLVGGFAALALLLGVVGLYGVIAYSVSQRTHEIGIRMALGAERKTVYQMILGEAARLAGAGIVAGLVCSLAATKLMHSLLFGVHPWDVSTLAAVVAVLAVAALLASFIPARHASKVDPMVALRYE